MHVLLFCTLSVYLCTHDSCGARRMERSLETIFGCHYRCRHPMTNDNCSECPFYNSFFLILMIFIFFFLLCSFRTGFVIIQGTRIGFESVVYIFPWEKFLIFFQPLLCFLFAFPIVLDFCCSFHVSSFARSLRFSLHSALLFAFYLFIPVKMYTLESSKYTLCQSVFVHLFLYCCARNSNFYMRRAIYKFHIYLFIYLLPSPSAASNGVSWRVIQNQTRKREAESGKKQQQNYGYFVCDCEKLFLSPSKKNKREWSSFAAKKSGRRTKTHAKERKEKAAKSVDDDWWKERRKLFHFWIAVSNGFWVEWIKKTKQFFSASKKRREEMSFSCCFGCQCNQTHS